MNTPSLNPSAVFLNCTPCVQERPEDKSPQDVARQQVGFTSNGDLVVWCITHDSPIAIVEQGKIDKTAMDIVDKPCPGCGKKHAKDHKEIVH